MSAVPTPPCAIASPGGSVLSPARLLVVHVVAAGSNRPARTPAALVATSRSVAGAPPPAPPAEDPAPPCPTPPAPPSPPVPPPAAPELGPAAPCPPPPFDELAL